MSLRANPRSTLEPVTSRTVKARLELDWRKSSSLGPRVRETCAYHVVSLWTDLTASEFKRKSKDLQHSRSKSRRRTYYVGPKDPFGEDSTRHQTTYNSVTHRPFKLFVINKSTSASLQITVFSSKEKHSITPLFGVARMDQGWNHQQPYDGQT